MKYTTIGAIGAALALRLPLTIAKHGNAHLNALENRHRHSRGAHVSVAETGRAIEPRDTTVEKRGGQCQFPTDAGLVAVTPNDQNGGWAMSPDQCCEPGNYCPYACPPGQVMAQWDPDATAYTYPQSMVRLPLSFRPGTALMTIEWRSILRPQRKRPEAVSQ